MLVKHINNQNNQSTNDTMEPSMDLKVENFTAEKDQQILNKLQEVVKTHSENNDILRPHICRVST